MTYSQRSLFDEVGRGEAAARSSRKHYLDRVLRYNLSFMQTGYPRSLCCRSTEVDLKSLRAIRARSEARAIPLSKACWTSQQWASRALLQTSVSVISTCTNLVMLRSLFLRDQGCFYAFMPTNAAASGEAMVDISATALTRSHKVQDKWKC